MLWLQNQFIKFKVAGKNKQAQSTEETKYFVSDNNFLRELERAPSRDISSRCPKVRDCGFWDTEFWLYHLRQKS